MTQTVSEAKRWRLEPPLLILLLLLAVPASAGQASDINAQFIRSLAQFSLGIDGTYGDEGASVRASLEALTRDLGRWDDAIRTSEAAVSVEVARAEPSVAARMHAALGGEYLDRGRIGEALRELIAAARLDPGRPEFFTLQALVYSQVLNQPDAAIDAFQNASRLDARSPERLYLLARQLWKAGKTEAATATFQAFYKSWDQRAVGKGVTAVAPPFSRLALVQERSRVEPFFPPVLYADGFEFLARGEFDKAIAQFHEAAGRDALVERPVERLEALGQAGAALRDGSVQTAIRHLNVAVELEPNRSEAHRMLGRAYLADQQYDEAIAAFRTAVRLDPAGERAHVALADALVSIGRYPEAEQALRESSAVLPASGRLRYALGRLHQRMGRLEDAVRELQEAITFHPLLGLNGIYQSIGAMNAARQQFDAAVDAYDRRIEIHPNDADAHQDLGATYLRLGRHDEALAEFAVVLMLGPGRADAYTAMAQVHLREARYNEAVEASRRAVELDASDAQARYALGTSLLRLGRNEEGQRELQAFQRLQADAAAAHTRELELGGLRREAAESSAGGDHEKAVSLLRKALELQPDAAISHLNLGLALLYAGRHAEAIERFTSAVALDAPPEVHQYMAQAYAALGQLDDSRRELSAYERSKEEALRRAGARR